MKPVLKHQYLRCMQHGGVLENTEELSTKVGELKQGVGIADSAMSHQGLRSHDAQMRRIPATVESVAKPGLEMPICWPGCCKWRRLRFLLPGFPISELRPGQSRQRPAGTK